MNDVFNVPGLHHVVDFLTQRSEVSVQIGVLRVLAHFVVLRKMLFVSVADVVGQVSILCELRENLDHAFADWLSHVEGFAFKSQLLNGVSQAFNRLDEEGGLDLALFQ